MMQPDAIGMLFRKRSTSVSKAGNFRSAGTIQFEEPPI
jgi:hypothetical protein